MTMKHRRQALSLSAVVALTAIAGCSTNADEKAKEGVTKATSAASSGVQSATSAASSGAKSATSAASSGAGAASSKASDAGSSASSKASDAGSSASSSASSGTDKAKKPFSMPDQKGKDLQAAQDAVQKAAGNSAFPSTSEDALGKSRPQADDSNWKVCSQTPAAGQQVKWGDKVTFKVVKKSETCPQ